MHTNKERGFCPCDCECGPHCEHDTCPCVECVAFRASQRASRVRFNRVRFDARREGVQS